MTGQLSIFAVLLALARGSIDCSTSCSQSSPTELSSYVCTFYPNGTTETVLNNRACSFVGPYGPVEASLAICLGYYSGLQQGILYPGPCGCPLDCNAPNGVCNQTCSCSASRTGPSCYFNKSCGEGPCSCPSNRTMNDCSAPFFMGELPCNNCPVPGTRFTDYDEGWFHSIFLQPEVSQLYIELSKSDLKAFLLPQPNDGAKESWEGSLRFHNTDADFQFPSSDGAKLKVVDWNLLPTPRKSFRLKFPSRTQKVKTVQLRPQDNDSSLIRDVLATRLLYALNSPTYRASYAQVFIRGENFGSHTLLEDVGSSEFLKARFNDNSGSLFRLTSANLTFLCSDWCDAYSQQYELLEGPKSTGRTQLIGLLSAISQFDPENSTSIWMLDSVLDLEYYLRLLAFEILSGHANPLEQAFLYYNPTSAKWILFRAGFETTFLGDYCQADASGSQFPLARLLELPAYRNRLSSLLLSISSYASSALPNFVQAAKSVLVPLVANDKWRSLVFPLLTLPSEIDALASTLSCRASYLISLLNPTQTSSTTTTTSATQVPTATTTTSAPTQATTTATRAPTTQTTTGTTMTSTQWTTTYTSRPPSSSTWTPTSHSATSAWSWTSTATLTTPACQDDSGCMPKEVCVNSICIIQTTNSIADSTLMWIGIGAGGLLLVVAVSTFLFIKWRSRTPYRKLHFQSFNVEDDGL